MKAGWGPRHTQSTESAIRASCSYLPPGATWVLKSDLGSLVGLILELVPTVVRAGARGQSLLLVKSMGGGFSISETHTLGSADVPRSALQLLLQLAEVSTGAEGVWPSWARSAACRLGRFSLYSYENRGPE